MHPTVGAPVRRAISAHQSPLAAFATVTYLHTMGCMQLSGAPRPNTPRRPRIDTATVEVLCDESGRLGSLSYLRPLDMDLYVGDAVRVPFGKQERYGVIVGPGDSSKATRAVLERFGPRTGETEIALAAALAEEHFSTFLTIAPRLAPRTRRGNAPLNAGPVALTPGADRLGVGYEEPATPTTRRILSCAPGVSMFRVAALEVERLSADGQVLVLCPTKQHITELLNEFASGAARMDDVPGKDTPSPWRGLVEGTLRVGVATRAASLWSAKDLAGIVVVDEAHPGHLEAAQPYTNARDVAIRRTLDAGIALTLVSQVPTLHALAARARLVQVGSPNHWPSVRWVSRADLPPYERLTPPTVLAAVSEAARTRRGAYVVAPSSKTRYRCASCRLEHEHMAEECSRCSGRVRASGFGPDRVATLYPKAKVLTLHELRTHRPHPGSTVVIFDLDALNATPDLSPSSTIASALYDAARIAGPGGSVLCCGDGSVPPRTLIDLLLKQDIRRHCRRVWEEAKENHLPPFTKMVTVRYKRVSQPKPPNIDGVRILGPRRIAPEEWEIVALTDVSTLSTLDSWVARLRRTGKVRITVA